MAKRARGEGTIYRRKKGLYEGKLSLKSPNGGPLRKSFYGKTRSDVANKMREYRRQRGWLSTQSGLTLAEYLSDWLGALDVRPNTMRLRRHLVAKHISPHIGERLLADLSADDIRFLLRRWKGDAVGVVTQRSAMAALSCALTLAFREDKIPRNPCNTVPPPKVKRAEVLVLDGPQAHGLISASRSIQERALLTLAITTGLRQGEIFALYWEDLDFSAGTLAVRKTLTEDLQGELVRSDPKTVKSRRVIHLPELALTALIHLARHGNTPQEFVFTNPDGTPLRKSNFIRRVFKPLLKQAKLPDVTFHSLRHTANSLLIEAGEDPLAIAGSLGHSDTRMMFERYGHLFSHTARRVAQTTNRIFAELEENCRTTVVQAADRFVERRKEKTRNRNNDADFQLVEMRRLELLTPYMRKTNPGF